MRWRDYSWRARLAYSLIFWVMRRWPELDSIIGFGVGVALSEGWKSPVVRKIDA